MPSLCSGLPTLKPGCAGRHDERGQAALAALGIGDGEHDRDVGARAVGHELLAAVENPVAVAQHRARAQVVRLGAGLRLGQTERADPAAGREVLQIAVFLRGAAEVEDRPAADRVVHAHQRGARSAARGDLFERERIGDVVGVRAAPLRRHDHAEKAEFAHLRDDLRGQLRVAIPLRRVRREPLGGEVASGVADHPLLVGVEAVHGLGPVLCVCSRWVQRLAVGFDAGGFRARLRPSVGKRTARFDAQPDQSD